MRHQKNLNHLGRTSSHRKAMLANMASSLIIHKRITTTLAKAKVLRPYIEPLLTQAKIDSTHARRLVFSYLQDKDAVSELFREISIKIANRPGGYTRILKTGNRLGDNAEMCMIELVDYNENLLGTTEEKKAKSTRRRGTGKKKATEETTTVKSVKPKTEVTIEAPKAEDIVTPEITNSETTPEQSENDTTVNSEKE